MTAPADRSIYLASRSPRRRELLTQIGVRYKLLFSRGQPDADPEVDESVLEGEAPRAYVERLARAKAEAGWKRLEQRSLPRAVVLAADTTVALGTRILGKPSDRREAGEMLAALSGQTHEVLTAVAAKLEDTLECATSASTVTFKTLSAPEIAEYVASGEWDDKAGGYGIQGRAARYITAIHGSYTGIVGLPLYETAELLDRMNRLREARPPR